MTVNFEIFLILSLIFSSFLACFSLDRIQDISILFNLIIILLMLFNTYVFQVGLVAVLLERFRAVLMLSALYLIFSIILHSWLMVRAVLAQIGRDILYEMYYECSFFHYCMNQIVSAFF